MSIKNSMMIERKKKVNVNLALQKDIKQNDSNLKRCCVKLNRFKRFNKGSCIPALESANNILPKLKKVRVKLPKMRNKDSCMQGPQSLSVLPNIKKVRFHSSDGDLNIPNAIELSGDRDNKGSAVTRTNIELKAINTTHRPVIRLKRVSQMVKSKENMNNHVLILKNRFNSNLSSTSVKPDSKQLLQHSEKFCARKPLKELNLNHATENKQKEFNIEDENWSTNNFAMTPEGRAGLKKLSLSKDFNLENRLQRNEVRIDGNEKKGCQGDTIIDEKILKNIGHNPEFFGQISQKEGCENRSAIRILDTKAHTFFQKHPKNCKCAIFAPKKSHFNLKFDEIQGQRRFQNSKSSADNVYDFLSLSQSSESSNGKKKDPSADIIKKLIDEGKVRVATRKKGKLVTKRNKIFKKRNGLQETKTKILNKRKKQAKNKIDVSSDSTAVIQNEDVQGEIVASPKYNADTTINTCNNASSESLNKFARSIITYQVRRKGKSHKKLSDQRRLLEAAQKFVSTPLKNKDFLLEESSNLSPICVQPSRQQSGCSSPWRVDDDRHLPSVFYFGRNSSNLPTYSSDFIPSTPRKHKSSANKLSTLSTSLMTPTAVRNSGVSTIATKVPEAQSNNSNYENICVISPSLTVVKDNNTENSAVKPNLFREIICRKPLNPITILENISLPNWKSTNIAEQKSVDKTHTSPPKEQDKNKMYDSELFGFEEFLDNDSMEDQTKAILIDETNTDQIIRNNLHKLKHLRPTNNEIPQLATKKAIFDNDKHARKRKQIGIKEMLCSTMISGKLDDDSNSENRISNNRNASKNNDIAQLFSDPATEANFDDKHTRRTYARTFKKARKLRHNFVMFPDSDESGDESDGNHEPSYVKDAGHNKKKYTKNPTSNVELESFAKQFNEMCKEVDQYKLIVE